MIGPSAPTDFQSSGGSTPNPSAPPTPTPTPPPQPAPSLMGMNEFASAIKAKYPAYQNVDNATLTAKMIAKYPQYASIVHQTSPGVQKVIDTPTPSQSLVGNFFKSVPKAATQTLVGGPVKLGTSLAEGVDTTLRT